MKKMLIGMFALCLGLSAMAADYNAMDLGFWFGFPGSMKTANVRGWRLGLVVTDSDGYVSGAETSILCAGTAKINGLQAALGWCQTDDLAGLQAAIGVNLCNGEAKGTQISCVILIISQIKAVGKSVWVNCGNNAKFQLGLININKGGLWSVFPFINFGKDTFKSSETIRAEAKAEAKAKAKAKKGKK